MNSKLIVLSALSLAAVWSPAAAQTGTEDQVSPFRNEAINMGGQSASYNFSASSLKWQMDINTGISGALEGFELEVFGDPGAHIDVEVRLGGGWDDTAPPDWTGSFDKVNSGWEIIFFDTTSAGINLNAGDVWRIQVTGNDTGMNGGGSYVPPPGTALYPELLYLNGPGCFADCGWRIGFHTYMLQGGGLQLSLSGSCPGAMTATVNGATSGGQVALVYAFGTGSFAVPAGFPCAGTVLGLDGSATLLSTATAVGGTAVFSGNAPAGACGNVFLQAVDLTTCATSNVVGV